MARIRATTRSKVLVLSAHRDDDAVCAALAAGAGGFVGENQGIDDVVRSLHQVCAGKVIMPVETAPVRGRGPGRQRPAEPVALRFRTGREREALGRIAEGQSTKEIAQSMHVAYSTARTHEPGIRVVRCATGHTALRQALDRSSADVVLGDDALFEPDGPSSASGGAPLPRAPLDVVGGAGARAQPRPVVVLLADHGDAARLATCLRWGVRGGVPRSSSVDDLLQAVREALVRRTSSAGPGVPALT